MVKPGAVVIDVGINRVDDATRKKGYRLVGDVDFDGGQGGRVAITPVPGGVGPMTIAMLLATRVRAADAADCTGGSGVDDRRAPSTRPDSVAAPVDASATVVDTRSRRGRSRSLACASAIWVKGEISDLKANPAGHWYLLPPRRRRLHQCVVWATLRAPRARSPATGTEVYMLARPDCLGRAGRARMTAVSVLADRGRGRRAARAAAGEGGAARRTASSIPRASAPCRSSRGASPIVTSLDGAALHDMVTVARKRWPRAHRRGPERGAGRGAPSARWSTRSTAGEPAQGRRLHRRPGRRIEGRSLGVQPSSASAARSPRVRCR